jgi:hypothetical protein
MADQLSLRGGTTAEHATFTGANKEVTVDTTKKTLVVNDGATVGGHPLMRENASNSALALGSAGTPSLKFTGDPNTGIYSPGADQLAVATNGVGRLFVDSDGNIGIGGTTTTGWAQKQVVLDAGSGTSASYVLVNDTTGRAGTDGGLLTLSGSDLFLINREAANLIFRTSNAERLRITSTGLVGIGTSDAQNLLSLGLGSGTTTRILGQYGNNVSTTLEVGAGQASSFRGGMRIAVTDTGAGSVGDSVVSFHTTKDGGGTVQRLTIDQDGKVGIGTTSVDAKLHIQGVSGTYPTSIFNHSAIDVEGEVIRIGRSDSTARYHSIYGKQSAINSSNYLQFRVHDGSASSPFTSQSTVMTLTGQGRVGIGTTSPARILDVAGSADFAVPNGQGIRLGYRGETKTAYIGIDANDTYSANQSWSNSCWIGFESGASDKNILYRTNSNHIFYGANAAERARIDSSGRLLIGTSTSRTVGGSIQSKLQIEGTGTGTSSTSCSVTQNSNSIDGPRFMLAKSRGTANGSVTIVQIDDNLGSIDFAGADGTDASSTGARISAQVDGTPALNDMPCRLVFSTTTSGATSPMEALRIRSDQTACFIGNTGTAGVAFRSVIQATTSRGIVSGEYVFQGGHSGSAGSVGTVTSQIGTDGNVQNTNNSYGAISDAKLKENIVDASLQWDDLKALQVRNYNFKKETGYSTHTQIGLIAQEVELVSPGLVSESPDRDEDGNDLGTVTKSVNYSVLYMKAVKALQEAIGRIETLEAAVTALQQS